MTWSAGAADGIFSTEITKGDDGIYKRALGNNFMIGILPWGGMVIVYSGGTADEVPRSTGSVTCSDTSARSAWV